MTTPTDADVITQLAFPAVDAHRIARITYRQLDHWARQGWVQPSLDSGQGRSGKRLYSADDVVRLDLLRHLAMSKVNAAVAGPEVAQLLVPDAAADFRVLWGPVGRNDPSEPPALHVVPPGDALEFLERGGAFVVYSPVAVRSRLAAVRGGGAPFAGTPAAPAAAAPAGAAAAAPAGGRPGATTRTAAKTTRRRSA